MSRVTTQLLKVKEVCRILGISEDTFSRHWQSVFTENRDVEERKKGAHRRVYEDETAEALNAGGGTSSAAKGAVLTYRKIMGRM